jgi:hypothetical protein
VGWEDISRVDAKSNADRLNIIETFVDTCQLMAKAMFIVAIGSLDTSTRESAFLVQDDDATFTSNVSFHEALERIIS